MSFYNILWISIFALAGISLGILGLTDMDFCMLFLVNPKLFNELISDAETAYFNLPSSKPAYCVLKIKGV